MAHYYYESVVDYGWCSPDGTIYSGLTEEYVQSHDALARRLKLGSWKKAITLGYIRWGIDKDSTLYIEHKPDVNASRSIERLIAYTEARKVINANDRYI